MAPGTKKRDSNASFNATRMEVAGQNEAPNDENDVNASNGATKFSGKQRSAPQCLQLRFDMSSHDDPEGGDGDGIDCDGVFEENDLLLTQASPSSWNQQNGDDDDDADALSQTNTPLRLSVDPNEDPADKFVGSEENLKSDELSNSMIMADDDTTLPRAFGTAIPVPNFSVATIDPEEQDLNNNNNPAGQLQLLLEADDRDEHDTSHHSPKQFLTQANDDGGASTSSSDSSDDDDSVQNTDSNLNFAADFDGDTGAVNSQDEEEDDDSDGDEQIPKNIMERRAANEARNKRRLSELFPELAKAKVDHDDEDSTSNGEEINSQPRTKSSPEQPRGMLFSTPYNNPDYFGHLKISSAPVGDMEEMQCDFDREAEILDNLCSRYPGRDQQIMTLWSLLSPALPAEDESRSAATATNQNIPAPIFVTGPTGTGKTSIVRDVVTSLQHLVEARIERVTRESKTVPADSNNSPRQRLPPKYRMGRAYINCATLDSATGTIDEIVHNIYRQLAKDMKPQRSLLHAQSRASRRSKGKTKKRTLSGGILHAAGMSKVEIKKPRVSAADEGKGSKEEAGALNGEGNNVKASKESEDHNAGDDVVDKDKSDGNPGTNGEEETGPRLTRASLRLASIDTAEDGYKPLDTSLMKEINKDISATAVAESAEKEGGLAGASSAAQVATAAFGRELRKSLFQDPRDFAFLIIDEAQRLLSMASSSGVNAKSNFLSQLLLLPKTKGLNLTVIVITKSILLDYSRFNNLVSADRSLSTISSAIQPIKIHFPAYRGHDIFNRILKQPMQLQRLIGPVGLASYQSPARIGQSKETFSQKVVNSFVHTLVQNLSGSIRDLKELIRLGRSLWPRYIQPLHSANIEKSLESARRLSVNETERENAKSVPDEQLISLLDQRVRALISTKLQQGLYRLTEESEFNQNASASLPPKQVVGTKRHGSLHCPAPGPTQMEGTAYLTKCIMLAAFICQTNKADRDRQLFTIQKNGKKNNGNKKKSPDDIAFGSTRVTTTKSFRPRLFPMERMLSVFISIFGLNREQQPGQSSGCTNSALEISPGSSEFSESLSHLRDVGILQETPGTASTVNLVTPKYWCTLTREEAETIAKSVNFPLDNYLF